MASSACARTCGAASRAWVASSPRSTGTTTPLPPPTCDAPPTWAARTSAIAFPAADSRSRARSISVGWRAAPRPSIPPSARRSTTTSDPTPTSLSGDAEELQLSKVGGAHLLFQTGYQRRSAGFEINDLGYLQRADQQTWSTWMGYFDRHRRALYQRFQWNFNWWQFWTAAGLPEERAFNTNTHTTFN